MPNELSKVICGRLVGSSGKICIRKINDGMGCDVASHQRPTSKFELDKGRLFVLSENSNGFPFVYSTPSIKISWIKSEVFRNLVLEERSYEEWLHLFGVLESKLIDGHELNKLNLWVKEVLSSDLLVSPKKETRLNPEISELKRIIFPSTGPEKLKRIDWEKIVDGGIGMTQELESQWTLREQDILILRDSVQDILKGVMN